MRTRPRSTCWPPCWAKSARRGRHLRPAAGLARRLYRARDAALPCASNAGRATGRVRLRYGHRPERARPAGRRHGAAAVRHAACGRARAGCGWTGRRTTRARACVPCHGEADRGRRRALPLRRAGRRTDRRRCRWRALRRLLRIPGPGAHGAARTRSVPTSGCCRARARSTTRRRATGRWLPARRRRRRRSTSRSAAGSPAASRITAWTDPLRGRALGVEPSEGGCRPAHTRISPRGGRL